MRLARTESSELSRREIRRETLSRTTQSIGTNLSICIVSYRYARRGVVQLQSLLNLRNVHHRVAVVQYSGYNNAPEKSDGGQWLRMVSVRMGPEAVAHIQKRIGTRLSHIHFFLVFCVTDSRIIGSVVRVRLDVVYDDAAAGDRR